MTWRIYRFDDTSAPALTGQAGSLIALLDAVLVTGYGAKSAAGWTKPFTGTNLAAFQQGTGGNGHYFRVDDTSATTARVIGCETMTDVNTYTGDFPTNAQLSGGNYHYKSSTSDATQRPWLIAADSNKFVLWSASGDTTTTGLAITSNNGVAMFFGKLRSKLPGDAFDTAIFGNSSTNGAGFYPTGAAAMGGHYLARDYTQTGTSKTAGKYQESSRTMSNLAQGSLALPDPVSGSVVLSRVVIHEGSMSVVRGVLPAIWATPHNWLTAGYTPGDTFSGAGDLTGRTFMVLRSYSGTFALETSNTVDT